MPIFIGCPFQIIRHATGIYTLRLLSRIIRHATGIYTLRLSVSRIIRHATGIYTLRLLSRIIRHMTAGAYNLRIQDFIVMFTLRSISSEAYNCWDDDFQPYPGSEFFSLPTAAALAYLLSPTNPGPRVALNVSSTEQQQPQPSTLTASLWGRQNLLINRGAFQSAGSTPFGPPCPWQTASS